MICRLCLLDSTEVLNILEGEGERLKITEILSQHFWFISIKDHQQLSYICRTCWLTVDSFHQFYCFVKDAQKSLWLSEILHSNSVTDRKSHLQTTRTRTYLENENDDVVVWVQDNNDSRTNNTIGNDDSSVIQENVVIGTNDTIGNDDSSVIQENIGIGTKDTIGNDSSVIQENIGTNNIKSENYGSKDSTGNKFETVEEKYPIDNDSTNQNNQLNLEINTITYSIDNLITSSKNKISLSKTRSGTSIVKKRNCSEKRSTSANDNKDGSSLTQSAKQKPKNKNTKNRSFSSESRENNLLIASYMSLKCDLCSAEFTKFAQITRHYRNKHDTKGYAVCCNKKFFKKYLLSDHIIGHQNPEVLKCNQCDKIYLNRDSLKKHILNHKSKLKNVRNKKRCIKKEKK